MKKLIILLISMSFILVGCKAAKTNTFTPQSIANTTQPLGIFETQKSNENIEVAEVEQEMDLSIFPEIEPIPTNISTYRSEILKRINDANDDQFLYDYESNTLQDYGYYISSHSIWISITEESLAEVSMFYYPVIYRYKDTLVLWFTSEKGDLFFRTIYGDENIISFNSGIPVHFDNTSGDIILSRYESCTFSYNFEEGLVSQWQYGKNTFQSNVPAESIYCGNCYSLGYLFRSGTDVYCLVYGKEEAICIAHDVKFILDSNYSFSSEAMFQPLFIMEDGQVLAYVDLESSGRKPDDPNYLLPPLKEGGYR